MQRHDNAKFRLSKYDDSKTSGGALTVDSSTGMKGGGKFSMPVRGR